MPGTQSKDTKVGVKQSHHRSNYRQQELKLKNIKARAKQIPHQRKGNEKTRGETQYNPTQKQLFIHVY
jgi:hypothetical protein